MIKNTGWGSSTMKLWSNISGVMVIKKDCTHHLLGGIKVKIIMNLTVVEIVSTLMESPRISVLEIKIVTNILQVMYVSRRCNFISYVVHITISFVLLCVTTYSYVYRYIYSLYVLLHIIDYINM